MAADRLQSMLAISDHCVKLSHPVSLVSKFPTTSCTLFTCYPQFSPMMLSCTDTNKIPTRWKMRREI